MASKKKRLAGKRAIAKPAIVKTHDLAAATAASVRAVLGRGFPKRPGIVAGIWLDEHSISKLELSPRGIASAIAEQASTATGIKLKASVVAGDGGILVGYIQPKVGKL